MSEFSEAFLTLLNNETNYFAFTKMLRCGNCGNGIFAEGKFKQLRNGTVRKDVYYHY